MESLTNFTGERSPVKVKPHRGGRVKLPNGERSPLESHIVYIILDLYVPVSIRTMTNRTFIRDLRDSKIDSDEDLLTFMKKYDPTTTRKSGIRELQDYTIALIKNNINDATLIELFGVLHVLTPRIAGDALLQDVYHKIRRAVIDRYGRDSTLHKKSLTSMRFDQTKWRANKKAYIKKVAQRNREPIEFQFNIIRSVVERIYTSSDLVDRVILALLCSGARVGEVLYKASFKRPPTSKTSKGDEPTHYVIQQGILKSKTLTELTKPILFIDVNYFIRVVRQLKIDLLAVGIDSAETATAFIPTINRRTKKYFNDEKIHTHDLRKIYANIAFQVYAKKEKDTAYVSDVLGHDRDSVQVSTSYLTLNVNMTDDDRAFVKSNLQPIQPIFITVPRNTKQRDGQQLERLKLTVDAMRANDERITARTLKLYGYGSRIISDYLKGLKLMIQ